MKKHFKIWLLLSTIFIAKVSAQEFYADNTTPAKQRSTIYLMPNVYPAVILDGDTIACIGLKDFIKYSPMRFSNNKQQIAYTRLVRDVKKTLPYAKEIARIITETYEYMETLPDDKARQKHLNQMERYLYDEYKPKMSKLTRSQGQLLIKLVDRETNSSSYHIVDAFMGSAKAITYNFFASLFGNSLKRRYNPYGDDRVTERVCVLVEQGAV